MGAHHTIGEARALAARGSHVEALAALDAVLAEDPAQVEALLLKGSLLLEARRDGEAVACYERAVQAAPRSVEALNGLALALHVGGRNEEALATAEAARRALLDGDDYRQVAPVYLTLVWCLRELKQYREALAAAEEGLARTPDAILAQWASVVEEELAEAQKEGC